MRSPRNIRPQPKTPVAVNGPTVRLYEKNAPGGITTPVSLRATRAMFAACDGEAWVKLVLNRLIRIVAPSRSSSAWKAASSGAYSSGRPSGAPGASRVPPGEAAADEEVLAVAAGAGMASGVCGGNVSSP